MAIINKNELEGLEVVHDTLSRQKARELRSKAETLAGEARVLKGIKEAAPLADGKEAEAARLQREAEELQDKARLEDLTVRQEPLVKQTKKGERTYYRWLAS